jgi:hypothetical protein
MCIRVSFFVPCVWLIAAVPPYYNALGYSLGFVTRSREPRAATRILNVSSSPGVASGDITSYLRPTQQHSETRDITNDLSAAHKQALCDWLR